jgi:Flp pilus assembly pilin Flp
MADHTLSIRSVRAARLIDIKGTSMTKLLRFLRDDTAATATEYAVMLALIIGVCIGAISFFGSEAGGSWTDTSERLDSAMSSGGS